MSEGNTKVSVQSNEKFSQQNAENATTQSGEPYKRQIVWTNVSIFIVLHSMALYGIYLYFTATTTPMKIFFWIYAYASGVGITGGAHRLWAHRAYKARLPMRILLMLMQSAAHQNNIYEWTRDHRAHHKYTDTNADPHNATRGFFFSHMGWLIVKKHPDVRTRGTGIDMSDVLNDPVVAFQRKYFFIIMPIMCFILPTAAPMYLWGDTFKVAIFVTMFRYMISLHFTWLVNSAAHMWGNKPYDKDLSSRQNLAVSLLVVGEGWHNYHHVYPWDYKAAELGNYRANITTGFIDFFSKLGLAYDLKSVPLEAIRMRTEKTGDGSWTSPKTNQSQNRVVWGWDDKDLAAEDKEVTRISKKGK